MFKNQNFNTLFPLYFLHSFLKKNNNEMKHIDKLLKIYESSGSVDDFFNLIRYIIIDPCGLEIDLTHLIEKSLELLSDYYHEIMNICLDENKKEELKSNIVDIIKFSVTVVKNNKGDDPFLYEILKYIISLDEFIETCNIDLSNIMDVSLKKLEDYNNEIQDDKRKSNQYKLVFTNILKFLVIFVEKNMIHLEVNLVKELLSKYFFTYQFNNVIWGHIYMICTLLKKNNMINKKNGRSIEYDWDILISEEFLERLSRIPHENNDQDFLLRSFYRNFESLKYGLADEDECEEQEQINEEEEEDYDNSSFGSMGSVEVSGIYDIDIEVDFDDMKDIKFLNDRELATLLAESKYNHDKLKERIVKILQNCL